MIIRTFSLLQGIYNSISAAITFAFAHFAVIDKKNNKCCKQEGANKRETRRDRKRANLQAFFPFGSH